MFLDNTIFFLLLQAQSNPQSQGLNNLFLNEAFSNYVLFILGIIVGIIGWLIVRFLTRRRPQIIEVVKKEQVSLLNIDSQVEKDIKLEYKGNLVNSLYRTSLDLFNQGEETIKDFTLTIKTDTQDLQNKVLEKLIVDSSDNEIQDANVSLSGKNIEMTIKFLNPFKQYRDQLKLYIFSSSPIKIRDAKGRGPGWGVLYFDQVEYEKELEDSFAKAISGGWYNFAYGLGESLVVVIKRFIR
ncbi:MAG: hypothetical protein KME07_11130 [Pegethrix bostrychoides GSE-TBD4-15B]|jgi:uncharacterized membrane-anchored protein YhcB (DUF1043 family)|uniref:Uncharacterized protein n=1 Tax=Pegethrix bostrychoides GSE-TBD4-15B TaxID=2839662 RepID=A0A951U4Y5_9CYAN|nr:hypothetical protein [Pegethrix bostrychoides GSE-TBD4-15B]